MEEIHNQRRGIPMKKFALSICVLLGLAAFASANPNVTFRTGVNRGVFFNQFANRNFAINSFANYGQFNSFSYGASYASPIVLQSLYVPPVIVQQAPVIVQQAPVYQAPVVVQQAPIVQAAPVIQAAPQYAPCANAAALFSPAVYAPQVYATQAAYVPSYGVGYGGAAFAVSNVNFFRHHHHTGTTGTTKK
jgi:hypothetical protein